MTQMRAFMTFCANLIKKGTDEDDGGERTDLIVGSLLMDATAASQVLAGRLQLEQPGVQQLE